VEEALVAQVLALEMFHGVTPQWVYEHERELRRFTAAAGEVVLDQGEPATEVFAVISGRLQVNYRDALGAERLVSSLGTGDTFGEIALLNGGVRTSVVRAMTASDLVALTDEGFRELLADHPGLASRITTVAAMRLRHRNVVADAMEHLGLSDHAAVSEIEPLIEWMQLSSGEVLFNEGELGDSAYVVLQGRLLAVAGRGSDERVVGEIGRGEVVGEMAVLDREPRNATVFAIRDTHLARLPPAAIDVLLDRFPHVMLHVARTVLRRVRRPPARRVAEDQLSITVVALDTAGPAQALAGELAAALGRLGTTEHLTSERVDSLLGRHHIAQSEDTDPGSLRLLPWLHDLEERSRYVVYEADGRPSVWSRRVLRQSDQVLFVAGPGDRPGITALEQQARSLLVGRGRPRTGLVLLHHPSTTMPRATADWLQDRSGDDVYHVRIGHAADIDRLARILAGRGVSLVLGGGGARGFAHLGVLRALHELEVPVDLVGGTSIGAVIAVLPATETPVADMPRIVQEQFHRVFDYTLPVASVISARRIVDALRSA